MDGGPRSQELLSLCPHLHFKPLGLEDGEGQWVSEERAYSDFPLEKEKKIHLQRAGVLRGACQDYAQYLGVSCLPMSLRSQ